MARFAHEVYFFENGKVQDAGWWRIEGDKVVNENGGYHSFDPDENSEIITADSFDALYEILGTKAFEYLIDSESPFGWLSPAGEWFPCKWSDHSALAQNYLRKTESELENTGWIKVSRPIIRGESGVLCINFLTEAQRQKLQQMGIDPDKVESECGVM